MQLTGELRGWVSRPLAIGAVLVAVYPRGEVVAGGMLTPLRVHVLQGIRDDLCPRLAREDQQIEMPTVPCPEHLLDREPVQQPFRLVVAAARRDEIDGWNAVIALLFIVVVRIFTCPRLLV